MKITFNLREPEAKQETPIRLIVRYKPGHRLLYATELSILPKFWNFETYRTRARTDFHNSHCKAEKGESYEVFNRWLQHIEDSVREAYTSYKNQFNEVPTPEDLRELLDIKLERKKAKELSLFGFIEQFIEESKTRVSKRSNKIITFWTRKQYRQLLNILRDYAKHKNKKELNFEDINYKFYNEFTDYLLKVKKLSNNTIGGHFKNIKVILNNASKPHTGITINPAYKEFSVMREDTPAIYLNEDELMEMYNLDLSKTPGLERVRDLFIVAAYTAQRYGDLSQLTKENIIVNAKGSRLFKIKSSKTGKDIVIPVLPITEQILKKYDYELPHPTSNQKMNESLKQIAVKMPSLHVPFETFKTKGDKKVITKFMKWELVTTHCGRRSAATNFWKRGIPVKTIMNLTGHSEERMFYKYIKEQPEDAAEVIIAEFINNPKLMVV